MTVTGDMRTDKPYRQMELNPRMADGDMHSPENEEHQIKQARQQAEFYEQQLAQWEAQRQELAENSEQKALFDARLNEVGMKLHNAVHRLTRELDSMEQEHQELAQVTECLQRHLTILSALQPRNWSPEGFRDRLREALPKLGRAENDFHEAYALGRRFRHTQVFHHKPGEDGCLGLSWKRLGAELARGLAFHLPLFLLLLASWLIYHYALA